MTLSAPALKRRDQQGCLNKRVLGDEFACSQQWRRGWDSVRILHEQYTFDTQLRGTELDSRTSRCGHSGIVQDLYLCIYTAMAVQCLEKNAQPASLSFQEYIFTIKNCFILCHPAFPSRRTFHIYPCETHEPRICTTCTGQHPWVWLSSGGAMRLPECCWTRGPTSPPSRRTTVGTDICRRSLILHL